jgi:hypothetical protein
MRATHTGDLRHAFAFLDAGHAQLQCLRTSMAQTTTAVEAIAHQGPEAAPVRWLYVNRANRAHPAKHAASQHISRSRGRISWLLDSAPKW